MIIKGIDLDQNGRCKHYNSMEDIVAIRFKCCDKFYACYQCHLELEEHVAIQWQKSEFDVNAIMCGNCKEKRSITDYLSYHSCQNCTLKFNPNCSKHYHYYFET